MGIKLIGWDIQDTLISRSEIESAKGQGVIRGNALELITRSPQINLTEGILPVLMASKNVNVPNGVISSFAYQFGINLIAGSELRDYVDPRLVQLAHKHAWESMVLGGDDYEVALSGFVKPSTKMYELLLGDANRFSQEEIRETNCLYIGDNDRDAEASRKAGWNYLDISEVDKALDLL